MPFIYNIKTGKKCRCLKDQTEIMLKSKKYSLDPPKIKEEEPKKEEAPKQEPPKQEPPKAPAAPAAPAEPKKEAPKAPAAKK